MTDPVLQYLKGKLIYIRTGNAYTHYFSVNVTCQHLKSLG